MTPKHRDRILRYAKSLSGEQARGFRAAESMTARPNLLSQDEEAVDRVIRGRETEADAAHLEAIIFPKLRPVFEIEGGSYETLPAAWEPLNEPAARARVEKAIRAIGRVEIIGHPKLEYGGTGFLVGNNLLLTNRHVAAIFTSGLGVRNLTLTFRSQVDLKQEAGSEESLVLTVTNTRLIHPHWDAALLTVSGVPADIQPLTLASESLENRMIAVVGYPAFDPRNNVQVQREVFRDLFEKKRLQPGFKTGSAVVASFGHEVEAATHDASTLGGNSGSAVIDVETGMVLGLHFAGVYLDTNYAAPAWELALDPKLVDLGVNFAKRTVPPGPKPVWLRAWDNMETPAAPPAPPAPAPKAPCNDDSDCTWTIPIQVTIRVGNAVRAQSTTAAVQTGAQLTPALDQLREARRRITEDSNAYYPEATDRSAANSYYSGIRATSSNLYRDLSQRVRSTHTRVLSYKPAEHLYPLVDLQPDGDLISIYSGVRMDPESVIRAEAPLEEAIETMMLAGATESAVADLEAIQSKNAEHVVPQSWFDKRQPMKGDLHHLFACEARCNSFRSNTPFFEFGPEERVMEDCGRSEPAQKKFEPLGGKGPVARATLYFLLRYPGEINRNANEYTPDRLRILLRWHRENPVSVYERHRNREIFLKQGNRNPLIDHPDWADSIDFRQGLGA